MPKYSGHPEPANDVICKLIAYNLTVLIHETFENGFAPESVKQNPAE